MSSASREKLGPYVGWCPYSVEDKDLFFGRELEVASLTDLLIAQRIVVLHASSGAGKTSLVQAGLIPRLAALSTDQQLAIHALPVIRVGGQSAPGGNRFIDAMAGRLGIAASVGHGNRFAKAMMQTAAERAGHGVEPLLIFDQFEEIFLRDPGEPRPRAVFFDFLGEVLTLLPIRALFILRDDYVGALEPLAHLVPTKLAHRMRLELLRPQQARDAIRKPPEAQQVTVTTQAVDSILATLGGATIEPLHLQVVCASVWEGFLRSRATNPDRSAQITLDDVKTYADLDHSLQNFLTNQIEQVVTATLDSRAEPARDTLARHDIERGIRRWLEKALINGMGRVPVREGPSETAGLGTDIVRRLYAASIVGIFYKRSDETWYELAHDRLILPLRKGNAAWRDSLTGLQAAVEYWVYEDHNKEALAQGRLLRQFRRSVAAMPVGRADCADEREFVVESRNEQHKQRGKRRVRTALISLFALLGSLIVAAIVGVASQGKSLYRLTTASQVAADVGEKVRDAVDNSAATPEQSYERFDSARQQLDEEAQDGQGNFNILSFLKSPLSTAQRILRGLDGDSAEDTDHNIQTLMHSTQKEWLRNAARVVSESPLLDTLASYTFLDLSANGVALAQSADNRIWMVDFRPAFAGKKTTVRKLLQLDRGSVVHDASVSSDGTRGSLVVASLRSPHVWLTTAFAGEGPMRPTVLPTLNDSSPARCVDSVQLSATGDYALMQTSPCTHLAGQGSDLQSPPGDPVDLRADAGVQVLYVHVTAAAGPKILAQVRIRGSRWIFSPTNREDGFFAALECAPDNNDPPPTGVCPRNEVALVRFSADRAALVVAHLKKVPADLQALSSRRVALLATEGDGPVAERVEVRSPASQCHRETRYQLSYFDVGDPGNHRTLDAPICSTTAPTLIDSTLDGRWVAVRAQTVQSSFLGTLTSEICVYDLEGATPRNCDLQVTDARFSPDGNYVATASAPGLVRLWYLGGPISASLARPVATLNHVAGRDDLHVALPQAPGTILTYNTNGARLWRLPDLPVVTRSEPGWHALMTFMPANATHIEVAEVNMRRAMERGIEMRLARYTANKDGVTVATQPIADVKSISQFILAKSGIATADHDYISTGSALYTEVSSHEAYECAYRPNVSSVIATSGTTAELRTSALTATRQSRLGDVLLVELCELPEPVPQALCFRSADTGVSLLSQDACAAASGPSKGDNAKARVAESAALAARLSPSGHRLLVCAEKQCAVFDRGRGSVPTEMMKFKLPESATHPLPTGPDRWGPAVEFSPSERFVVIRGKAKSTHGETQTLDLIDLMSAESEDAADVAGRNASSATKFRKESLPRAIALEQNSSTQGVAFGDTLVKDGLLATYTVNTLSITSSARNNASATKTQLLKVPDGIQALTFGRGQARRCVLVVTSPDNRVAELWNWEAGVLVSRVAHEGAIQWSQFVDADEGPFFWTFDADEYTYTIDARRCSLSEQELLSDVTRRIHNQVGLSAPGPSGAR